MPSAWRRIRNDLATGKVPGAALIDGGLIFLAGVLLIIPGYVSDMCGLLLLVPPVRAGVRGMLRRRYAVQVSRVDDHMVARPPTPRSARDRRVGALESGGQSQQESRQPHAQAAVVRVLGLHLVRRSSGTSWRDRTRAAGTRLDGRGFHGRRR